MGRILPRVQALAAEAPPVLLLAASAKAACVPAFFLYLKSPAQWHNDATAVAFVSTVWCLGEWR